MTECYLRDKQSIKTRITEVSDALAGIIHTCQQSAAGKDKLTFFIKKSIYRHLFHVLIVNNNEVRYNGAWKKLNRHNKI